MRLMNLLMIVTCAIWVGCPQLEQGGELPTGNGQQEDGAAEQEGEYGAAEPEVEGQPDAAQDGEGQPQPEEGDGAATVEEVREETAEAISAAEEFAAKKQQQYRQRINGRLDKVQQHISGLREDLAEADPAITEKTEKLIADMEAELSHLREEAAKETEQTEDAWQEFTATMNQAVDELEKSVEDVREQVTGESSEAQPSEDQPQPEKPQDDVTTPDNITTPGEEGASEATKNEGAP